jgi:hypothetical protein
VSEPDGRVGCKQLINAPCNGSVDGAFVVVACRPGHIRDLAEGDWPEEKRRAFLYVGLLYVSSLVYVAGDENMQLIVASREDTWVVENSSGEHSLRLQDLGLIAPEGQAHDSTTGRLR